MVIAGVRERVGLMAAAACLCACGPISIIDRASEPTSDAAAEMPPDAPIKLPSDPMPPNNPQPSGGIDPIGFPEGSGCKDDGECRLHHCADGVCCQLACDGLCQSCNQPDKRGLCLPVAAGQDPDNECADDGASSCGGDGACDGAKACRRYPAGTVCAAGGCDVATERAASLCDGNGVCVPGAIKNCDPAMCLGDHCGPPCVADADCAAGRWCDGGTCRIQIERGAPCDRGAQCSSGFCTDGVCCNTACKDACYACDQAGSAGECTAIPDGQDPGAECPVEAIGTCGNGGGCNGHGACRKHPMGTWCGYGMCLNDTQYGNSTCDGMGGCKRGPGHGCGVYTCNGNLVCWTACANDAQCAPNHHCNIHTCE